MERTKRQCSAIISIDNWHTAHCSKPAKIERDGKWFCGIHDPEYIKVKESKREVKYEAGNCKGCGHHFYESWHRYCPLCGRLR